MAKVYSTPNTLFEKMARPFYVKKLVKMQRFIRKAILPKGRKAATLKFMKRSVAHEVVGCANGCDVFPKHFLWQTPDLSS